MEFPWNEAKRLQTIEYRNLDFKDASRVFDGRASFTMPTPRGGEERWKTVAEIAGKFYTVVSMWREEKVHIISMRRAHEQEIRKYRDAHGG